MDLNAIKARLDALNQPQGSQNKEKKDYTKIYWKPREAGKFQIRFLPSIVESPTSPFQEIDMHYNIGKYPIVALTNWGEKDPVVEFIKKLRNSSESENWRLANKLGPKMRVFAPVIVRGEEDKGVRIFEFSKTLYAELLSYADADEYGEFEDVAEGFDFTVTAAAVENRRGFNLTLRPKRKPSPLSEDASLIEKWLEEQPLLLEERFHYKFDKLKEVLAEFINSSDEQEGNKEGEISSEPAEDFDDTEKASTKTNYSQPKKEKQTASKKFDDLFEDGEDSEEVKEDDLPF
jgi:hypothetical protein